MRRLLSTVLTAAMLVLTVTGITAFALPQMASTAESVSEAVVIPEGEDGYLASETTGYCGDNLTWTLGADGTLTVSGTGEMDTWYSDYDCPWLDYRSQIKNVVIEDGVTSVSYMAFDECTSLETVTIGKDVEDFGSYCFNGCAALKSITVDKDNDTLYSDSFGVLYEVMYDGEMLLLQYPMGNERTSYTVPDKVQNICTESFRAAVNLKSITLSDGVRFVDYGAFSRCAALESLVFPDSVETVAEDVFNGCESLKSVTLGSGVYTLHGDIFGFCPKLETIVVDNDNGYYSSDSNGVLYSKDKTVVLKFPANSAKTSFAIPDGARIIREGAFDRCEKLKSVEIPDSVTSIETYAFYGCENLADITMGENVEEIGEYAFYNTAYYYNYDNWEGEVLYIGNCAVDSNFSGSDFHYEIKDGTKTIANNAFDFSGIASLDIPDSVMFIGSYAFYGNGALSDITLGDGIKRIGQDAFSATEFSENESNRENGLLYIGKYLVDVDRNVSGKTTVKSGTVLVCDNAFEGCYDITSVVIPDSVKYLGKNAFLGCGSLESVSLGSGITELKDNTFNSCSLESIVIPNGIKTIGEGVFYYCTDLKNVTIGSGVESIGDEAFHSCYNLETIVIPDSVKTIGKAAFYNCGLTSATIGIGVTSIGEAAFDFCNGLTIYGYAGSVAQKYANENRIDFVVRQGSAYIVSYDANGGSGAPASQAKEKNKNLTISKTVPTRNGYTFKGWSTTPHGKVEYMPGATYKSNASVTLYAVWEGVVVPDEFVKYVKINDGVVDSLGLHVEAVDERTLTVTFSGITIRDGYVTNLSSSDKDMCEYEWSVIIYSDSDVSYEVSTTFWASNPGRNERKTIDDMQHSVWKVSGYSGNLIADAEMSHTSDSITWTFSVPQEYDFDFYETTQLVAVSRDVDGTDIRRVYKIGEEEDLTLANAVEFTPLKSTSLAVGKTLSLSAKAYRRDGLKPKNTGVVYQIISGNEYATVDAKGTVKGIGAGEVTVRATAVSGTADAYEDITINVCIPATKVTLNMTKATMAIGLGDLQLVAEMTPVNNTDTLTWSSSNEQIATVDENGVVTAHKSGSVKITAQSGSGKAATCSITIGAPADTVTFSSLKSTSLAVGKTLTLSAKASCKEGSKPVNTAVTYEIISGNELATIDNSGKIKGIGTGEVTVRATAVTGTAEAYADVIINVCIPTTKVTLNMTNATMAIGLGDLQLVAEMTPVNNTDTLTWSSSNEQIATVDENGVVTAHKSGSVKINAQSGSGKAATCSITVGAPADTVTFGSLKSTYLAVGKTLTLSAKASCKDGSKPVNTAVTYEIISGEDLATVDAKGTVKGIGTGEVTVRATAVTGTAEAYADVIINVCIPATKVTLNMTNATMASGLGDLQLVAEMTPVNNTDTLTWSSSNEQIATVDENGIVTAHKAGSVKINAQSGSGKAASCSITVGAPADTVTFGSLKSTSLAVGKTLTLSAKASCKEGNKPVNTAVTYEIISGEDLATVDAKGTVKGIGVGEVTVRATAVTGTREAYADVIINVCIPTTKVTLNMTKATMAIGLGDLQLVAEMTPVNNTDTLTWSSSNEQIATVDENGVVTAHKSGSVKINAQSGSGKAASCSITVGAPADTVTFSSLKSTSLAVGKTLTLSAKASCKEGNKPVNTAVTYEIISGEDLATIDNSGKVKGIGTGEVTVRATAVTGTQEAYADVIINVCIPITTIKFAQSSITLNVGAEAQCPEIDAGPENHTDTWILYSSNENVVRVSEDGTITAVAKGSAKVYVESGSGKKATLSVKVVD